MKFFCRHHWEEKERFHTPPSEFEKVTVNSHRVALQLSFGVTTILYRCHFCTAIKTVQILGKEQVTVSGKPEVKL